MDCIIFVFFLFLPHIYAQACGSQTCNTNQTCLSPNNCVCKAGYLEASCARAATSTLCFHSGYCLYWDSDNTNVYIQAVVQTTGWFGIITGSDDGGMTNGDAWQIRITGGTTATATDAWSIGLSQPSATEPQNLLLATGHETGGSSYAYFQRAINTGDNRDRVLTNGQTVAWATAAVDTISTQHNSRGRGGVIYWLGMVPTEPLNPRLVEVYTNFIIVAWDPPAEIGNSIITYSVEYSPSSLTVFPTLPATTLSANLSGLALDTRYSIRIAAISSKGRTYSAVLNATTLAVVPMPPDQPLPPTAVSIGTTFIVLNWMEPNLHNQSLQSYTLQYSPTSSTGTFTTIYSGIDTQYNFTGLSPSSTYWFRLTATSAIGSSPPSAVRNVTTSTLPAGTCPNNCSGHGTCNSAAGVCYCNIGYLGQDCSTPAVFSRCERNDLYLDAFCIYWTYDTVRVTVQLAARSTGWIGLVLGATDYSMVDADIWVFRVNDATGALDVWDMWSTTTVTPTLDTQQNLYNANGYQVSGRTIVNFQRDLLSNDGADRNITSSPMSGQITGWAFGPSDTFTQHQATGRLRIEPGVNWLQPFPIGPLAPINFRPISATMTTVNLVWDAPLIGLAPVSYRLDQRLTNISPWVTIYNGTTLAYNVTNLTQNTTYQFRIGSVNSQSNANYSDIIHVTTLSPSSLPPATPSPPDLLNTTASSLLLSWNTPNLFNIALVSFTLQRSTTELPSWTTVYQGLATRYNVTGLLPNTTYQFRLSARSLAGDSSFSTIVAYTTAAPDCPNDCSGHGQCVLRRCQCELNYLGLDCSIKATGRICYQAVCLATAVVEPYLYFGMDVEVQKQGYGALVFGGKSMYNSDCHVLYSQNVNGVDVVQVDDRYSVSLSTPTLDTVNNLEQVSGYVNSTHIVGTWRRLLTTSDSADKPIQGGSMDAGLAFGQNYLSEHQTAAALSVNFYTGDSVTYGAPRNIPNVLWFLFFLLLVIVGLLLQFSVLGQSITNCLKHKKIGGGYVPTNNIFNQLSFHFFYSFFDLTYSEFLLIVWYLIILISYVSWWKQEYRRVGENENFAFAKAAVIHLMLTLFVPTRNSVWRYLLGISYDRILKFHRWIARITLLFIILHLADQVAEKGSGILGSGDATLHGAGAVYGFLAFLGFLFMSVLAFEPIRRAAFELFLFAHFLYIPSVIFAIAHYIHLIDSYLIVPLLLLVIDYALRWYRTSDFVVEEAQIVKSGSRQLTRLVIKPQNAAAKAFDFTAGDFAFLTIPTLSRYETHPFSISSSPGEAHLTFHILDMGGNSFTHRLAQHIQSNLPVDEGKSNSAVNKKLTSQLAIQVQGPYGKASVAHFDYPVLILAAGGIGATPIASMIGALKRNPPERVREVHFIWVCREESPFTMWWPQLFNHDVTTSASSETAATFHFHFFATGSGSGSRDVSGREKSGDSVTVSMDNLVSDHKSQVEVDSPPRPSLAPGSAPAVRPGRPDFDAIMANAGKGRDGSDVAVMACGPSDMIARVQRVAGKLNYHFHKEVFLF